MSDDATSFESVSKARAKIIADLDRAAERRTHGLFRIEGWRALTSAVQAGASLEEIVVRPDALDAEKLALVRSARTRHIYAVGRKGMARLTSVVTDQGVVATARIHPSGPSDLVASRRILALDGVQDPGNVGTLIRSAAWFGIDAVLGGQETADFFNPKVVRATAGAIWDVSLVPSHDLPTHLSELKDQGFRCFGADLSGPESPDWAKSDRSVLVLGSEARGLSDAVRALMDGFVFLHGRRRAVSGVESLNVATAGSILISRWTD